MSNVTEPIEEFKMEANIPMPARAGRSINNPLYFALESNMKKMEVKISFPVMARENVSADNLEAWVRKIEKTMNDAMDPAIRDKNPYKYAIAKIKDTEGKKLGVRVWRTQ